MGSGRRITAGPDNDARHVYDVQALRGDEVQVNTESGSGAVGPVTGEHSLPPPHSLTCS